MHQHLDERISGLLHLDQLRHESHNAILPDFSRTLQGDPRLQTSLPPKPQSKDGSKETAPGFLGYDARAFLQNQVMRRTSEVRSCHVEYEYQKKSPEQAKHIGTTSKTAWVFSSIFLFFFFLLTMAAKCHPETQNMFENSIEVRLVFCGQYDAVNRWIIDTNFLRAILQPKHPKIQREKTEAQEKKLQNFQHFTMDIFKSQCGASWVAFCDVTSFESAESCAKAREKAVGF